MSPVNQESCDTPQTLKSSGLAHLHGGRFVLPLLGNPFWSSSHGAACNETSMTGAWAKHEVWL